MESIHLGNCKKRSLYTQVVSIYRWSLEQVWLYSLNKYFIKHAGLCSWNCTHDTFCCAGGVSCHPGTRLGHRERPQLKYMYIYYRTYITCGYMGNKSRYINSNCLWIITDIHIRRPCHSKCKNSCSLGQRSLLAELTNGCMYYLGEKFWNNFHWLWPIVMTMYH